MLLLFDSLAAIVQPLWMEVLPVEQWSRLLPILTRFEKSKSCENAPNGKESGSHCTITCKCSLKSMHHKFIRHVFVIEKLLYNIIYLNYATLINNFPLVLPPVRSRCAF